MDSSYSMDLSNISYILQTIVFLYLVTFSKIKCFHIILHIKTIPFTIAKPAEHTLHLLKC